MTNKDLGIRAGLILLLAAAALPFAIVDADAQDQIPQPAAVENVVPADPQLSPAEGLPPATGAVAAPSESEDTGNLVLSIAENKRAVRDASITPEGLKTIFFTAWQHALLEEAKIGFNTRLPDPGDVGKGEDDRPAVPGIRELTLGGIAFAQPGKWTIWFNGVRITPDAIPEQILDIKVTRSYVDIKWYDSFTKKIYPVRMRPHERFNLDARIFLPGTGTM